VIHVLTALVHARAGDGAMAWLEEAGAGDLRVAFPAVARHVGRGGLDAPGAELVVGADRIPVAAWRVDDAARALLLVRRGSLALAGELYFLGDAREKIGALRALSLLPDGDEGLAAVLDAMRVNQGEIFEAAILDNPYASRHLPQHEWRKAVLKCVFLGHSIRRVARLDARADAELGQSLLDYALEREAATRSVPAEIWPVAALHPPPGLAAKLLGYLEHPADDQRAAAAVALGRLADPRVLPFLADRASRETVPAVKEAIRCASSSPTPT
jgi:hypothetical protein